MKELSEDTVPGDENGKISPLPVIYLAEKPWKLDLTVDRRRVTFNSLIFRNTKESATAN